MPKFVKLSVGVGLMCALSGCNSDAEDGSQTDLASITAPGANEQGKPAPPPPPPPPPTPDLDYTPYTLVWSDEFDGTTVDATTWTPEIGNGANGWGNWELQYYTGRTENARVESGALVIEARKEAYSGFGYTSARLTTQGLRSFGNGIIEARIKTPTGNGYWPAFWLMGDDLPQVGWPRCGEIDVMENTGTNSVLQYSHWFHDAAGSQGDYGVQTSADITQYHVFSIRRTDSVIEWYIDGVKRNTLDITPASLSEFRQTFFILLNVAVGGNLTGAPRRTTVFPQSMLVDYVRVYQ